MCILHDSFFPDSYHERFIDSSTWLSHKHISYFSMPDYPQQTSVSLENQFLAEDEVGFNNHSRGFSLSKTELNYFFKYPSCLAQL